MSFTYFSIKDLFDRFFALFFLVLLAPVLSIVFILVLWRLGPPVFFCQRRIGLLGRSFPIFKFRTMNDLRDVHDILLPDSQRLTPFGLFLRSTSIDELPSLLNILRGEMSFIGPRPLLVQYLPLYTPEQSRRHLVKPGFSGLAQINGRNALSWEDKFRFDVWYVDHQCFWLDLRILLVTCWKVLLRDGISAPGEATIQPFAGSNSFDETD